MPSVAHGPAAARQPVYDIILAPTPTLVQSASVADVTPAGGAMETGLVILVASVVAGVLVLILRARRR